MGSSDAGLRAETPERDIHRGMPSVRPDTGSGTKPVTHRDHEVVKGTHLSGMGRDQGPRSERRRIGEDGPVSVFTHSNQPQEASAESGVVVGVDGSTGAERAPGPAAYEYPAALERDVAPRAISTTASDPSGRMTPSGWSRSTTTCRHVLATCASSPFTPPSRPRRSSASPASTTSIGWHWWPRSTAP